MTGKVGFVGLGIMGRPMARNLLAAGYELVVHNRSRGKAEGLAEEGASVADNPKEVAESCETVITMLSDSPQVEEVLAGENGVFEGVREGALLADMSTISPVVAKELAAEARERGASMLDAPVSGGEPGAEAGTLSIMVGGSVEDFDRAQPLFEVMGTTVVHVGDSGTGQVVKACNQIVVALTIEAVSEALVLGSKAGVDPAKVVEVLSGGMAGNKVMEVRGEKFLKHEFDPGFKIELHRKDLGIALAAGREYGVPLPVTGIVDQVLEALVAKGLGGKDHSAILTFIEDLAQHKIGEGS
ncbi:MAG: 2-hydroxy-3-oxopropionate reductase [Actinomycetota bacterium]|jgi:2-hydroxy-3-oxopropionate reductase|nr:2-hydroxy-3-oxopropionate reductase [Actinomycetota bacterium]MDQ3926559.1 2-hydroxy-3-oxopropionate reductase [Actinomycetota bacterium]